MTGVSKLRRCRPAYDPATCPVEGCYYNDPDGSHALAGREKLRTVLITPGKVECDRAGCTKCTERAKPFTATEADHVLRHVTDRQAVLYQLQLIELGGLTECANCFGWEPGFHPARDASPAAVQPAGWCPFHPGGVSLPGDIGWRPRHPLDRPPDREAGPVLDDDGEPWSNL